VPGVTEHVEDGAKISGENLKLDIKCHHVPTSMDGHTMYLIDSKKVVTEYKEEMVKGYMVLRNIDRALFSGGAMFIGGTGGFFEGTPKEMFRAVNIVLEQIPKNTKMFPSHNNAVNQLEFSLFMDKENQKLK
jgi:glyoxylase-like metal-dependent hydrolase (beta-lactamase superfamily II)